MIKIWLIILIMVVFSLAQDFDKFTSWRNYLTLDVTSVMVNPASSISIDSTAIDSLQLLITFGHADWDSAKIDTMRTGGSYAQWAKFGLADSAAYNDTTYYAPFDSSNVTYYARIALIDSLNNYSTWKVASKRIDLTPESENNKFNYVFNFLLR